MSKQCGLRRRLNAVALSAAILGALSSSAFHATPAMADGELHLTLVTVDYGENDGDWAEFFRDSEGKEWIILFKNYRYAGLITPSGDPGPDDDKDGRTDTRAIIELLKQHGGPLKFTPEFAKTPLGKLMIREAKGIVPVYNPVDAGFEGDGDGIGGGGFDPGGGSLEQQLKHQANKGNKDGAKGDDGSDLRPDQVGLFDDSMPGPPPLVNPNPVAVYGKRTSAGSGGGSGGGSAGGSAGGGAGGGSAAAGH